MTNEIITTQTRELSTSVNAGTIEVESQRAIAEIQGMLTIANKFPRDMLKVMDELREACKYPEFAAIAFYTVKNRGTGLSIRAAEEVARIYRNFTYGHRELSRDEDKSEIECYAFDMERNNRSSRVITVMHTIDTQYGAKKLTSQADIDGKIANVAAKQMRGRILALVPKFMTQLCVDECKKTLAGSNDVPIAERVQKLLHAFAAFKVNKKMLEKYIGNPLFEMNTDQIADLIGIFNALREGNKVEDYFVTQPSINREEIETELKEEDPKAEQQPETENKNLTNTVKNGLIITDRKESLSPKPQA